MVREFHFPSALVIKEERLVRVRFWARSIDQLQLVIAGQPQTANYEAGADIILLVDGGGTELPDFPEMPIGEQLFAGEALEMVFKGACVAEVDDDGLHVTVDDGVIDCIRSRGLPFDATLLNETEIFNMLGDVTHQDTPPHKPPL